MTLDGYAVTLPYCQQSVKVFVGDDPTAGPCDLSKVWWEQKYLLFLGRLAGASSLKNHRKNEKQSKVFERIVKAWGFAASHVRIGDSNDPGAAASNTRMLTHVAIVWLLVRLRNAIVWKECHPDFEYAFQAWRIMTALPCADFASARTYRLPIGGVEFDLVVGADASLQNLDELCQLEDVLPQAWSSLCSKFSAVLPGQPSPRPDSWMLFLFLLHEDKSLCRRKPPWLYAHMRWFLLEVLVLRIDWSVLDKLQIGGDIWDSRGDLIELRTRSGRKHRIDSWAHARTKQKCDLVGGSSNACSQIVNGPNSTADWTATHCLNVMYMLGMRHHFGQVTKLCLNWDPASYSGHQYNMGLAFSSQTGVLAVMPPKVGSANQSFSSYNCLMLKQSFSKLAVPPM